MDASKKDLIKLVNRQENKASAPLSIVQQVEQYGFDKVQKSVSLSFFLAIFAGAFISIAFVFYVTVTTGTADFPWGITRLIGGVAFSLGLILVVICGGELFTSTVLSSLAWASKRISSAQLIKCWIRVYLGNLIGAALLITLVISAKMHLLNGGEWGINALQIASHKLEHTWGQAFSLGILCNMLVCLGVWMTFSSKNSLTKSILLILPVAMFVSSGFEHSIANLFMVPLGLTIKMVASPEFFLQHGYLVSDFAHLNLSNFIFHNLIPVTLGNIVGGAGLIGIGYWLTENKTTEAEEKTEIETENKRPLNQNNQLTYHSEESIMKTTLNNLTVQEIMHTNPLTFTQDKCIYQALALLDEHQMDGAPVVDNGDQLIGFVSQQDILRLLWSEEYSLKLNYQLADVMQTEILTIDKKQAISSLIEFMVVDKEKLFPVDNSGMLMSLQYQSYEQRLKGASANRPSIYPVIDNNKICGLITRKQIATLMAKHYLPDSDVTKKVA